jgi:predicted molibdopterin-dependent oxidoreductase YjgC
MIEITINGKKVSCQPGMSVAAALMNAGIVHFRESVSGENRGPLCGMGVCFECRVTINRVAGQRSCTTLLEREMDIETSESNPCTDEHR